ncbi:MAG: DUF5654 family protein [Candidatus Sifarchaeia archaeon]|jgi:uncharacterized membrane protein YidH (DUF202 family)
MRKQVIEKFATLVTAAFGFVAALAWNSAIQEIFKMYFGTQSNIPAMLAYAIVVTLFAVFITLWIGKIAERAKR